MSIRLILLMKMPKSKYIILRVLKKYGPLTPKMISEKTNINYNTVRGVLHRMVKEGLIKRKSKGVYELSTTS